MTDFWSRCKPQLIPEISDADLEVMLEQIKPITSVGNNRFREIVVKGVDRRKAAFTWEPKLGRAVQVYCGGLNDTAILTFHTWAYYGFFKPNLAEVYGCIKAFVPDWSAIRFFWLNSEEMDRRNIIGNWHWCPCILFGDEQKSAIDAEWSGFAAECVG